MRSALLVTFVILAAASCAPAGDRAAMAAAGGCPPGATCPSVDPDGALDSAGTWTAQCTGRFADFVDSLPGGYAGPRFVLAQDYPAGPITPPPYPWASMDFRTEAGAVAFMTALRDYIYDGMLAADFRPQADTVHRWFRVPWMHVGAHPREFVHGLTQERPLSGPELGLRPGVTVQNYAVGFYNDVGATAIGAAWQDAGRPDAALAQSPVGTIVFKILFSAARAADFSGDDILAGAPTWQANIARPGGGKALGSVRLLQIDVAVRDLRALETGWIFGTFAYDRAANGATPWHRMVPVGVMWGNDPTLLPGAGRPTQTVINSAAPAYALGHLGRAGRLNGPVDNPASACLSCHGTAQTPAYAGMMPPSSCSPSQSLLWFRNLPGSQAFGDVRQGTCRLASPSRPTVPLDYSLQQGVAFRNFGAGNLYNPCGPPPAAIQAMRPPAPRPEEYPVER